MTDLKYENYKQYEVTSFYHSLNSLGIHHIFKFDNGYGASVIKNKYSFGGEKGLFELAVILFDKNNDYDLCYTTDITDDVIGYLSNDEVLHLLDEIMNLKGMLGK